MPPDDLSGMFTIEYFVGEGDIEIVDGEMLDHYDQKIIARVSVDNHPVGNDRYGAFTAGLMDMRNGVWKRSPWVNEKGCPLLDEVVTEVLDKELGNYLRKKRGSVLLDSTSITLPPAIVIRHSRWEKILRFLGRFV